jgi:hypothetical protein
MAGQEKSVPGKSRQGNDASQWVRPVYLMTAAKKPNHDTNFAHELGGSGDCRWNGQMTDDNPRRIPSAVLAPGLWLLQDPAERDDGWPLALRGFAAIWLHDYSGFGDSIVGNCSHGLDN